MNAIIPHVTDQFIMLHMFKYHIPGCWYIFFVLEKDSEMLLITWLCDCTIPIKPVETAGKLDMTSVILCEHATLARLQHSAMPQKKKRKKSILLL